MVDSKAVEQFNKTAEKWRNLAEKRRLHFEELHQTGRWKYYFTESLFYRRLSKAAELVDIWEPILPKEPSEPSPLPARTDVQARHRKAA
jgi:hypothetical protein